MTTTTLSPARVHDSETRFEPNDPWKAAKTFSEDTTELRYCLYVRKSSEDDERQALSIDSQIAAMRKVSERDGLNVVEVIKESKSAKASWVREGFNELMNGLAQKRYNAVLAWSPDRLSRNAGDLGSVVDLMDQGCLKEIRTNGQIFKNAPNEKFLLMILCSQAKLENDNRSINVVRWLRSKAQMGHIPHLVPLGYMNQRSYLRNGGRTVIDPDRAPFIKQIFEKAAYEGMSGRAIQRWLLEETPFRTRSGKPIVVSAIYTILNNPMYYGMFEYPKKSGNWCKWEYEPIITKELFDEAQAHLSLSPRYRPRMKHFEFTKIIKCGHCGSGITAQEKFKKIAGQKELKSYVYYHCSKYNDHFCKEQMVREDSLMLQLLEIIDQVDIDMIAMSESLTEEIRRYNLFQSQLLRRESHEVVQANQINIREYMKYMICNGSRDEKRGILSMIQAKILLKDRKVYIPEEAKEVKAPKTKKSGKSGTKKFASESSNP